MTFESFTYKPNPKKVKEDTRDTLYIVGAIVFLILVYIFLFRGLLAIALFSGIAIALIRLKMGDNKKKGANRFGSLVERLTLTCDLLIVGENQFKISELDKFEIDADDFLGKSTDFFGTSSGTENYIEFVQGGKNFSFQFQVKKRFDLKLLSEIAKQVKHNVTVI